MISLCLLSLSLSFPLSLCLPQTAELGMCVNCTSSQSNHLPLLLPSLFLHLSPPSPSRQEQDPVLSQVGGEERRGNMHV